MTKTIKVTRDRCLTTNGRRHIPLPTGPYQNVGFRDIMIGFSRISGIMVRLYYPAADTVPIKSQHLMWPNWLPHENYREGLMSVGGINWSPFKKILRWYTGDVFIPALPKAKPMKDRKMPLIVFSHGVGACRSSYSALCLDLASHGFIVAAVEHRDGSACCTFFAKETRMPMSASNMNINSVDGPLKFTDDEEEGYDEIDDPNYLPPKALSNSAIIPHITTDWIPYLPIKEGRYNLRNKQIHRRVKECIRTLDLLEALNAGYEVQNLLDPMLDPTEFENLIDIDSAVIMGHSFGGATTLMTLSTELRFKVGVCLDAWMYPIHKENFEMVTQPVLFINTQSFHTKANLRAIKQLLQVNSFDHPGEFSNLRGNHHDKSSKGSDNDETNDTEANKIERKVVTIKNTVHYNQTDIPFVMPWAVRAMIGANSSRNFFTAHDLTSALSLSFIHKHLDMEPITIEKEVFLSIHKKKLKEGIKDKI